LVGLLASLPLDGDPNWTVERRRKFMTTFEAVLDFCFPPVKASPKHADDEVA
jgi:hypothetical protein